MVTAAFSSPCSPLAHVRRLALLAGCAALLLAAVAPASGVTEDERAKTIDDDPSYARTVSPDGKIEASVLLHSRRGIRVEMNLNKNELELWISPQAGKSVENRYRNLSNRDDHTRIFDRIAFPELGRKRFLRCDYDPFHSVLHYEGQVVHLATLLDSPVVLLWTEQEEVVDFKSDKQDTLLEGTDAYFGVRHPDRGLVLDYFAGLGGNGSTFLHQQEPAPFRSLHARAVLQPGQFLVLGGELATENVRAIVAQSRDRNLRELLTENEAKIAQRTRTGAVVLRDVSPELQRLTDVSRRHMLSVQDASGALRAALRYVYYLIWATDGTVCATSMMQTGDSEFLRLWNEYLLANPTRQKAPPGGRFYGQLVNEQITKREEFGSLCAVWPAFMYFGLTGDDRFVSGEHLALLEEVVGWMERYCYDPELGAIGTFYLGGGSEDPFLGSHDYGHDAAVGSFMDRKPYHPMHDGAAILRAYEYKMNLNQYNMYLMLAAVTDGSKSQGYIEKARVIERFLERLDSQDASALYRVEGGGLVPVKRKAGASEKALFAIQHEAPAVYAPNFARAFLARMKEFTPFDSKSILDTYACQVYGHLAGLDTEFVDEKAVVASLEATVPHHVKPSRYIPMPYAMAEYFGAPEGSFHDIRPQAFSTAPFLAAITNLAVRTLPFGVAIRASNHVGGVKGFDYRGGRLNVTYEGNGRVAAVRLNGRPLRHTLQLPDSGIVSGENEVRVTLSAAIPAEPRLIYSTLRLLAVDERGSGVQYAVQGYAQNVMVFRNVKQNPTVKDARGDAVACTYVRDGEFLFVEFFGKGGFNVSL